MTPCESPTASKIWAPRYEATVETPIFDMTLSTPLPSALTMLRIGLLGRDVGDDAAADEVLDRLERQVGVDGGRAVADEQGDVVHLADVARLDQQADHACASSCGRGGGARRRRAAATGSARAAASLSRSDSTMKRLPCRMTASTSWKISLSRRSSAVAAARDRVQARRCARRRSRSSVAVVVDVQDLGELVVVDHRERQHDLAAVAGVRLEQVALGADDARAAR